MPEREQFGIAFLACVRACGAANFANFQLEPPKAAELAERGRKRAGLPSSRPSGADGEDQRHAIHSRDGALRSRARTRIGL